MNSVKAMNIFLSLALFFIISINANSQTTPFLNIKDFGAVGDGKTDDTPALLKAMEAATKSEGTVYIPHGNYGIHPVKVPSHITLLGYSSWSYANKDKRDDDYIGKTILTALSGDARALLDLESNRGIRIFGLTLDGKKQGNGMHGIYARHSNSEQNNCIEDCRIQHFTGSGIKITGGIAHTVSGNLVRSNGVDAQDDDCSQIWIENVKGAAVTGNTIWGWYNRKEYKFSYPYPFYGIIVKDLNGCVISQNAMYHSSSKEGISDRGGNENSIITQNAYVKPIIEKTEGGFRVKK